MSKAWQQSISAWTSVTYACQASHTRNGVPKKDQKDHTRFTDTTALQTQSSAPLKTSDPAKSVAVSSIRPKRPTSPWVHNFWAKLGYERAYWHKIIWNTESHCPTHQVPLHVVNTGLYCKEASVPYKDTISVNPHPTVLLMKLWLHGITKN